MKCEPRTSLTELLERGTMAIDDYWVAIETLLREDKKARTASRVDELRARVRDLLTTSEGRQSIRDRLGDSRGFPGKARLLQELVPALDAARATNLTLSLSDRQKILLDLLPHTKPAKDMVHWYILWILLKDGHLQAGQAVLESLGKIAKKGEDLSRELPKLKGWKDFEKDKAIELLEAAVRAKPSTAERERIEGALLWARARTAPVHKAAIEGSSVDNGEVGELLQQPVSASPPTASGHGAPVGQEVPGSAEQHDALAEEAAQTSPHPGRKQPQSRSAPEQAAESDGVPKELSTCLVELRRLVGELVHRQSQQQKQYEGEAAAAREDATQLREQRDRVRDELHTAHVRLQRETEITDELRREKIHLEEQLAEREHELATTRSEMQQVTQQLGETRHEIEAVRRRAEDYIHLAKQDRDSAVRTFQSELWEELKYYFLEVQEETSDPSLLNEDQKMLRRRLREIQETLRSRGVSPT